MSPNLFKVLLHMGAIFHAIKDVEKGVVDIIHGQPSLGDLKAVAGDLAEILRDGIFNIPGMTGDVVEAVAAELEAIAKG